MRGQRTSEHGRPITPLSVGDKERVAVIAAKLDELRTGLRRTRSSARRVASPRDELHMSARRALSAAMLCETTSPS